MKGLTLFKRQHIGGYGIGNLIIAAYHHPNSLTWRWMVMHSRPQRGIKSGFARVYRYRGFNFHAYLNIPLLGSIIIQTQPHVWGKV